MLASLQKQRELADYDPARLFDIDDAKSQIEEVRQFGARVMALLREEHWIAP